MKVVVRSMWPRRLALAAACVAVAHSWPTHVLPAIAAEPAAGIEAWVGGQLQSLLALYCHLHAHPEVSLAEKATAERFATELRTAGLEVTPEVGGHGVVGVLANGAGPTLMLRADLDALPVTEKTGLPYASTVTTKDAAGREVGVMHACGHDIHMTSVIAAARYLAAHRPDWRGTLLVIGQPAEERGLGARAMLEDRLFDRFPRPSFALALHVDAALAAGRVGVRAGYALANTDSVDITVNGRGGHGAYPEKTIDPIVQAAELVLALQTIVSREVKPTEPAVITVGSIHGGTKHNVIDDSCRLQLTVRSYSDAVRKQLFAAIERKARGIAASYGAPDPVIAVTEGTPALANDEALTARIGDVFRRTLGDARVALAEQSMGGEDFGRFGRAGVPILMYRLGTIEPGRLARHEDRGQDLPSLHSPLFYPDPEPTLTTGAVTMILASLELLRP